jgi:hypothetical protein
MTNAEGEYYYIEATPTARYQSIYTNIKCQGQAQLLFIDDAPKKSTLAISFGIVGAEVQDDGDACYSI